jgi:hypothetical protein
VFLDVSNADDSTGMTVRVDGGLGSDQRFGLRSMTRDDR